MKRRVISHDKAMEIVKEWHDAPKSKKGTVSCKVMCRGSYVYKEADGLYGAIDNRAGLCEVEDGFLTKDEAEAWIESREVVKNENMRRC